MHASHWLACSARLGLGLGLFAVIATAPSVKAESSCVGDCDGNGSVDVTELVTGVNLALGGAVTACATLDANGDTHVTVDELTSAIGNALNGCTTGTEDVFDGMHDSDLYYLTSDDLDGRDNLTPQSATVQNYLIDQVRSFTVGLDSSKTGDDAYRQAFPQGTNILGLIRGSELPDEYVIVGAHYDHFKSCNGVCNGATDNAAGVVAALGVAREIADNPQPPRRSVVIAFWDAEEDGLLGSQYYTKNPLVPLNKTVAYINFDIQGANLLPSLRSISFAVAPETGGPRLIELFQEAKSGIDLDTRVISSIFGQGRSDYFHFINAHVPTIFFTDSTGPCYHTPKDDAEIVDLGKLTNQSKIATRLAEALAATDNKPSYVRSAVVYSDVVVVNDILKKTMSDLARFKQEDQDYITNLAVQLQAVVDDGPANFDGQDINILAPGVLRVIYILTSQTCDGFLATPAAAN